MRSKFLKASRLLGLSGSPRIPALALEGVLDLRRASGLGASLGLLDVLDLLGVGVLEAD